MGIFWWMGATAVIMGLLGLIGLLAWSVDRKAKKYDKPPEGGESNED